MAEGLMFGALVCLWLMCGALYLRGSYQAERINTLEAREIILSGYIIQLSDALRAMAEGNKAVLARVTFEELPRRELMH